MIGFTVVKDNRIPTCGMSHEEARKRNALPVPAVQYGSPAAGGTYDYWDEIVLNPPAGAAHADIDLLYRPAGWEYVRFLCLANTGQNAFLADEDVNLLNAWLATGQAEPCVMAVATWGSAPPPGCVTAGVRPVSLRHPPPPVSPSVRVQVGPERAGAAPRSPV